MQLIQKGPDVPDRLMQAHEEGKVVFFLRCRDLVSSRAAGVRWACVETLFELSRRTHRR